ncbi:MAG: ribonuclease HI [Caldilineaceae bacterium]|nr:ribonuclease HI [Caldilineaceae bacterium]
MMAETLSPVTIYTDGACLGNPGPGGWAAILRYGEHEKELSGRFRDTTNNRMELRAAVEALNALKRPCQVELFTDSNYLRNGITKWVHGWQRNGWRTASKQPVKNQDLWKALITAVDRHKVNWQWTKGHAGDELNERADSLATDAARQVTDKDLADVEEQNSTPNLPIS